MTPKRAYFGLLIIIILLISAVFGGAYGINTLLAKQSSTLVALKTKVLALDQEQLSLIKAKKDIKTYTGLYNIARAVVPENKDQAQTVRQITDLAAKNNITLESINFPASTLGSSLASGGVPPPAPAPGSAAAATPLSISQLVPVTSIPGVYDMQLTVASSTNVNHLATYPELINFLQALENNRLTALVSSINIQPNSQNHNLFSFTLIVNVYIKPVA